MRNPLIMVCIACAVALGTSCAKNPPEISPNDYAAPAQNEAPAEDNLEPIEPAFDGRPDDAVLELEPRSGLTLTELVLIALKNNPQSRIAWQTARAAAAEWGRSRHEYYPQLGGEVEAAVGEVRNPQIPGGRSYGAVGLGLQYLLLDFGGREARVEAARQALIAANWSHDQTLQDILRDVPQAYYTYIGDRALVGAAEENLKDAQTTLNATEARHTTGVTTIADVLQARSSSSQAEADLAARRGSASVSRGSLATAVGWTADAPFDVVKEPGGVPVSSMAESVDKLVEEAKGNRPDLGAAQAEVRQKEQEFKDARALPFPKLYGGGTLQYQRFADNESTAMYGGFKLQIPLFAGFSMQNALRRARAELEAAKAQLTLRQQGVIKEVWDSYHNFKAVAQQYKAFKSLLASAQESYEVSLGRYKNGAADITELLNAQNTLASARGQLIDSRMKLYTSYAELMHAVGRQHARSSSYVKLEESDL